MKEFKIYADSLGNDYTDAIPQSENVFIRALPAETEITITVPDQAKFVMIQSNVDKLWVNFGSTPITVPTGSLDNQTIMLNPDIRYLGFEDTVRIISELSGQVVVSFYG